MADLYAIPYSPWSEKARWALDYHHFDYREITYLPMVSEPVLRLRLRRLAGRLTVPVLIDGSAVLDDSLDIARYADTGSQRASLFPLAHEGDILRWNHLAEQAMEAGRALATARIGRDDEAKKESLADLVPAAAREYLTPLASLGVAFMTRKYHLADVEQAAHRASLRHVLVELERCLEGGREYLLDGFTFADICAACVLQGVSPVSDDFIRMGPAMRRCFTDAELADEFAPLIAWRDALYQRARHQ